MGSIDASSLYSKVGNRYAIDLNKLASLDMNDNFKDFIGNK